MGKPAWTLFALGALVACGSSSGGKDKIDAHVVIIDEGIDSPPPPDAPPDAPSHDFSCVGQPLPTTADAQIDLSGNAQEVTGAGSTGPLVDAATTLCKGTCAGQNILGNTNTDAQGNFAFAGVNTNGMPLDAYVRFVNTGDKTTLLYPPIPFTTSQSGIPAIVLSTATFGLLSQVGGAQQDAAKGAMALIVMDCSNMPITDTANVTLSIQQGGQDVQGAKVFDASAISPQAAGSYFVFNVPAGATTVSAKYMNTQFLSRAVLSQAGSVTETVLRPGP